jgi:hypothetical protein
MIETGAVDTARETAMRSATNETETDERRTTESALQDRTDLLKGEITMVKAEEQSYISLEDSKIQEVRSTAMFEIRLDQEQC